MWLFTNFGFFSVVRKQSDKGLTIRSRTRSDLDRLRKHYLPSLSPSRADEGTDYPWRANASSAAVAEAMRAIAEDISYSNFKDDVALQLGKDRAKRYAKVWSALYDMPDDLPEPEPQGFDGLPWNEAPVAKKAIAYGGVVIDPEGRVLLREVKNHFDGYMWTFAKGRPDKGESPRETALREVHEEMGINPTILTPMTGEFIGGTTINRFFLMLTARDSANLDFENRETQGLCWATPDEAQRLISQTTNALGRERDLSILQAALTYLPNPPPLKRPIARFTDWKTRTLPAARITLPLSTRYGQQEMATIMHGYIPTDQNEKWFVYYQDGILHCYRSWTGLCIFRVHFKPCGDVWQAWQVEINRHPDQYTETNERNDLELLDVVIEQVLINGPSEPMVDGLVQALAQATQPGYLGSPQVVSELLEELFAALINEINGSVPADSSRAIAYKITRIFSEDMDGYTRLPGWHSVEQLGQTLIPLLDLDADYCAGEDLHFLMSEGLASITIQIRNLLREVQSDPCSSWEQDALPKLQELHRFATAVLLGTASVVYPNKTIKDFS